MELVGEELERFWASIWEFCGVRDSRPYERVLAVPYDAGLAVVHGGGAQLRGEHADRSKIGRQPRSGAVAVLHSSELRDLGELTWGELSAQVAAVAGGLRALGVERGDRVVAYMPNIPETLVAFLATASLGAIWSSAAPEFGARSVIDRFGQIEPKVLLAVDGYRHGGKDFDRRAVVQEILAELPTVRHAVLVPYLRRGASGAWAGADGTAPGPRGWSWSELCERGRAGSRSSSRCPSTTRCGCSTPRARRACRRRSCTATGGS